ncbi:MAG: F0F1 ATP synthase subunit B [Acidiferrobacter sp.]
MTISVTLIVQMVTFGVLIFFVNRVLWGPLMALLAHRQQQIADGLAAAQAGHQALDRAREREEELVALARERAAEILDRAERRARELIEDARTHSHEEGAQLLALARAQAATELARARTELRRDVARLALLGAERIVEREIDPAVHAQLLHKVIEQL